MTRVLIPTLVRDIHAYAVRDALRERGHEAVLWFGTDFPTRQTVSVELSSEGTCEVGIAGVDLAAAGSGFDTVWFRRPTGAILPQDMHPGDRKVARRECLVFTRGVWRLVGEDAFWVNPLSAYSSASLKPYQLREAVRSGFRIPPTLCSNDPVRIREFLRAHRATGTIYKPFNPAQWLLGEGSTAYLFTAPVGEHELPEDDVLRLTPGIFQPLVPKAYEMRVTWIGEHCFAARLGSQASSGSQLDWRQATLEVPVEPWELSPRLATACRELMRRLGIVFGCFDFIVTPEGEAIFLEVNPMGQFLWVEQMCPEIRLLDAFCELLLQRRPDFSWRPETAVARFADYELRAETYAGTDALHLEHGIPFAVQEGEEFRDPAADLVAVG